MSKIKNEDFEILLTARAKEEKSKFKDLLFNSQKIQGLQIDEPDYYVKEKMFSNGYMIAYQLNNQWYLIKSGGNNGKINKFGDYEKVSIQFENGNSIHDLVLNKDCFIVRYTPTKQGLDSWLDDMCRRIARIDLAIENNLLYASMGSVFSCDNVNKASLKEALRQAAQGDFAVFASKNIADIINSDKIQASYYGDKFYELKRQYVKEVLTRLVGVVAGADKKERSTSFDMNVNESIDTAYIYIDTFNGDCEKYNLPFKMSLNSSVEDLYNSYFGENENTQKEVTQND